MAGRFLTPYSGRLYAVCVATWLLAVSYTSPVFASSPPATASDAPGGTLPEVATEQLHSLVTDDFDAGNTVNERPNDTDGSFKPADYLTPENESALRELLQEGVEDSPAPPDDADTAAEEDTPATIKARMPGVSDIELERYKRYMYRRDI
jgi:hypothetical protein